MSYLRLALRVILETLQIARRSDPDDQVAQPLHRGVGIIARVPRHRESEPLGWKRQFKDIDDLGKTRQQHARQRADIVGRAQYFRHHHDRLVTYGLRAHEVSSITLDDFDWKRERLCIPERKAGHSTAYPLSPLVGNAVIDYLRHARPETKGRQLFFRKSAPYLPLTSAGVGARASFYLHKAGIDVPRPGAHTLRHTCVSRLVAAEIDFKTIDDQ